MRFGGSTINTICFEGSYIFTQRSAGRTKLSSTLHRRRRWLLFERTVKRKGTTLERSLGRNFSGLEKTLGPSSKRRILGHVTSTGYGCEQGRLATQGLQFGQALVEILNARRQLLTS